MHKGNRKWSCVDCSRNTKHEHYFVRNAIWFDLAGMPEKGMLCILCLEKRIKRKLVPADFTNAHINNVRTNTMSTLLRSRILGIDQDKLIR